MNLPTTHIYPGWEEADHTYDRDGGCHCSPTVGRACQMSCKGGCDACTDGMVPVEMGDHDTGIIVIHYLLDPSPILKMCDNGSFTVNMRYKVKGV